MNITITESTVALALGILNIIGLILFAVKILAVGAARFAELKLKTDTLWDVFLKGGMMDAQRAGLLQRSSPDQLNPVVRDHIWRLSVKVKFIELYVEGVRSGLSESEIIFLFAHKFADELIEHLCKPLPQMVPNLGAALWAVLQFCKEASNG